MFYQNDCFLRFDEFRKCWLQNSKNSKNVVLHFIFLIIRYITCNTYETKSSLYLLKAIRRLSMDSPKLIHEISKVLNKVFVDGCEINKMMDEIKQFQKEAEKSEYNLDKLEGKVIRIEIIIIY